MSEEQRKEPRTPREEKIYIEILSAAYDSDENGIVVECTTEDLSSNGMRVKSNYPLVVGCILELLLQFNNDAGKFLLTGEVKWCRELSEEDAYNTGFELIESEHSDIARWRELFD